MEFSLLLSQYTWLAYRHKRSNCRFRVGDMTLREIRILRNTTLYSKEVTNREFSIVHSDEMSFLSIVLVFLDQLE